jgi:pimeloyl-ACP methyl ester carboxylesterase
LKVRGVDLAVREKGRGPTFLWGHGLLSSMAQEDEVGLFDWSSTADVARLVRYDARGHGDSEASDDARDYTWPSLAQDMLGVADALAAGTAEGREAEGLVVGGASMGCATAIHAALAAPERVTAMVLVIPPTAWRTRAAQRRLYRAGATMAATVGLGPFVALMRLQPLPRLFKGEMARMREVALRHLATADRHVVAKVLRGASQSDLPSPERLGRIRVPALILAWEGDPTHPVSTARKLARVLPQSRLHVAATHDEVADWPPLVHDFLADAKSFHG